MKTYQYFTDRMDINSKPKEIDANSYTEARKIYYRIKGRYERLLWLKLKRN